MNKTRIGYISANIAGDARYTDTLRVYVHDDGAVELELTTSTPAGGRDTLDSKSFDQVQRTVHGKDVLAKDIMKAIKVIMNSEQHNFKRYGKPTKSFHWISGESNMGVYGLNLKNLQNALGLARG